MKTYAYSGFSASDGSRRRGWIEAETLKAAREALAAQGILPDRIVPAAAAADRRGGLNRLAVRAAVFRELAALWQAGLPMVRALDVLVESPEWAAVRGSLAELRDRVRDGAAFSEAWSAATGASAFETAALKAGERAGALPTAAEQTAIYLEHQSRIRDRIVSALIYPCVVLVLTALIATGLLGFLLPTLARLWDESGIPLPAFTRAVMAVGRAARWAIPLFVLAGWGAAAAWRPAAARHPEWRERADRLRFRLPVFGRFYRTLVAFRFARALAMLLRGGAPMVEALALAGAATGSVSTARAAESAAEAVRHGRSPADALAGIPPLREAITGWMRAGLAGGNLVELLDVAADRQQAAWDRQLSRMLALLEPALVLVLGAIVLVVTLAIVWPMLTLPRGIG